MFIVIKILITATIIVIITEVAKFNDRLGAIIAAIPITTFLVLFWLYYEKSSIEKISNHMSYTLLYVLPTLPMFFTFPFLINRFGFYWAIILSFIITLFFIISVHLLSKKFGYKLFFLLLLQYFYILLFLEISSVIELAT